MDVEETLILPELQGTSTIIKDYHLHLVREREREREIMQNYHLHLVRERERYGDHTGLSHTMRIVSVANQLKHLTTMFNMLVFGTW